MDYKYLKSIIQKKHIKPTIINKESNFVVSTYWWGNGILLGRVPFFTKKFLRKFKDCA